MKGITISWREGPLRCEFRHDPVSNWLVVMNGDELLAKEPAPSASVAAQRARELADALPTPSVRRA
jgi:hypothetical protein